MWEEVYDEKETSTIALFLFLLSLLFSLAAIASAIIIILLRLLVFEAIDIIKLDQIVDKLASGSFTGQLIQPPWYNQKRWGRVVHFCRYEVFTAEKKVLLFNNDSLEAGTKNLDLRLRERER